MSYGFLRPVRTIGREPGGFMTLHWVHARRWALMSAVCCGVLVSPAVAQQAAEPAKPGSSVPLPELVVEGKAKSKAKPKTAKKAAAIAKPAAVKQAAPATEPPLPDAIASDGGSTAPGATDGYVAKETSVGTKTATPLNEIPQSISTVTRKQLEDRKPLNLQEALGYTAGVRIGESGYDPRFETFKIRGFDAYYSGIFRDGLRELNNASFGQFRAELYGIDSLTVLKGPSSTLYGASNAGGIVDMYTKRPTATPFNEVEVQVGSYERFQGNFDFSGPIAPGSDVLYRMTGVIRDSETQQVGIPDDRLYLAPAISFRPDADTKVTIFGEYMDMKTGGNTAYLNVFDSNGRARRTNIFSGDPAFNDFDQTQERVGYEIERRVNDAVTLRQKARYGHLDSRAEYIDIDYGSDLADDIFTRNTGLLESEVHTGVIDNQAEFKFSTGPIRHVLLAGVDAGLVSSSEGYGDASGLAEGVPDLVNYNYGQQHIPAPAIESVSDQDLYFVGAYLQDQIKLDRWILTLGGRHDWVHSETDTIDLTAAETESDIQNDQAWSGRAGLTYLFESGFAPYIAYGTSFLPNAGVSQATQTPFDPTTSKSKEAGIKYFVPGRSASVTTAVFEIEQENGLVAQFVPSLNQVATVQAGVLRARGFDIDATASLGSGLSVLASYAYLDMTIVEGDDGTNGNKRSSVPRHTFSLYGDYTMQSGAFRGLGFGAGVRYIGTSFGDEENTFGNEARALVDAAAHYDLAALDPKFTGARLQLNATNIFDTEKDVCSSNYCYRDQGRSVLGSLRYRW